jgi:predicted transcriptional regulator
MKNIEELAQELSYTVFTMEDSSAVILDGYTSDLLSDVMGNASEDSALITIQAHKNTIAVASLIGMHAIILCNGRAPADDMIEAAKREQIAILGTSENQFTVSYRLAKALGKV